jgi:hypothetical protein
MEKRPVDFVGSTLIGPEHPFFNAVEMLYARVDEVWLTQDNGLILVDTKAGYPRALPKRYIWQLGLCALAAAQYMKKHGYHLHERGFIRWEQDGDAVYVPVNFPSGNAWLHGLSSITRTVHQYKSLKEQAEKTGSAVIKERGNLYLCSQQNHLFHIRHIPSVTMNSILPDLGYLVRAAVSEGVMPDLRGGVLYTDALGGNWYTGVLRHSRRANGVVGLALSLCGVPRYSYAVTHWQKLNGPETEELLRRGGGFTEVKDPIPKKQRLPQSLLGNPM